MSEKKDTLELLVDNGLFATTNSKDEQYKICEQIIRFIEIVKSNPSFVNAGMKYGFDLDAAIKIQEAYLQDMLNKQIDAVIHHEKFTKLEGKWRGLFHLVANITHSNHLFMRVLCVSKENIAKDLLKAYEFDQSTLFKKIYEEEYGTPGGTPYSCMIIDEAFEPDPHSTSIISAFAKIGAAAHCPMISSVSPTVFNIKSFSEINQSRDMSKNFQTAARVAWRSLCQEEDIRYMSMVIPRILARSPYSVKNNPAEHINYNETVDAENKTHFAWKNAAYALAVRIAAAHEEHGWPAAIRGMKNGLASDLNIYLYEKPGGELSLKCPTEVSITDRREKELSDLGFIVLCHVKGTNSAVFFSVQTLQIAKQYKKGHIANANARMSTSLAFVLIGARIAQHLKIELREVLGTCQTHQDLTKRLQTWIAQYILLNPVTASQELKAQMPLSAGQVEVELVPGTTGSYNAIMRIVPHYQLDDVAVSLRLVASLEDK